MRFLFFILVLTSPFILIGQADNHDFQSWQTFSIQGKVGDKWKIRSFHQLRVKQDISKLTLGFAEFGAGRSLNKKLFLGASYRLQFARNGDSWLSENRTFLDLIYKTQLNERLTFSNGSRIEYRIFEHTDNFFRYRNMATLDFRIYNGKKRISVFGTHGIFFRFKEPVFDTNWLFGGLAVKLNPNLTLKTFYQFEIVNQPNDLLYAHILGVAVNVNF